MTETIQTAMDRLMTISAEPQDYITPARTLNGLRSKGCFGNWSRGPSAVFW